MPLDSYWFGAISYGSAALGYGAATLLLAISHPGGLRASLLTAAAGFTCAWAGVLAFLFVRGQLSEAAIVVLDAGHILVWIVSAYSWLRGSSAARWLAIAAAASTCWVIAIASPIGRLLGLGWTAQLTVLGMTVVGLLVAEQVLRNARAEQRKHLRLACLAVGSVFVVDLFVYSEAVLLSGRLPYFWDARGFANAALLPLIVIATKRQSEWQRGLFVSRQVTFYTASLLAVSFYLLAMGGVAYALRFLGLGWSPPVAVLFMFAAAALLIFIFFSAPLRRRFRTFLIKHFYRHKYDYRLEWLRLTQTLGRANDFRAIASNALTALATIAGSRSGHLWLQGDTGSYDVMASLAPGAPAVSSYDAAHPLVRFLTERSWVIDSAEYAMDPDRYRNAFGSPTDAELPRDSLVIPLDCKGTLQGFVTLDRTSGADALNFEDHDILKTAGKQVAVALAQALALEKLAETRQFEAMNKMATFLMHDLKNILAQQQLVVANAAKFRQRPDFIDDAITTLRAGADRMRYVLEQLDGSRSKPPSGGRCDVSKALIEVRSHCADRTPIPEIRCTATGLWVPMEREKLMNVLMHLVRNAQDATPGNGSVTVAAEGADKEVVCTVADTGCGMDGSFVRDRLFRPFDTTKGPSGMGVGAYQARELVRAAGGTVEVTSELGAGTTFTLRFPRASIGSHEPAAAAAS
jgi:putative PEP-CTERM system histidine kinase